MSDVVQNSRSPRRSMWPVFLTEAAITTLLFVFVVMFVFRYDEGDSKSSFAKAGTKTLETGVTSYRQKFGKYPAKLEDLVNPPDGAPYVDPAVLNDPWGRPYQYDPAGPRNQGRKPDVWTTGNDGELIGNWPEPRRWWDW